MTALQSRITKAMAASNAFCHLHSKALHWRKHLSLPHAMVWLPESPKSEVDSLYLAASLLQEPLEGLYLAHDPLGKPYPARHIGNQPCFHISNSHDGNTNLLLAMKGEALVGVGVDVVYLPRLRQSSKGSAYLSRLAARIMCETEWKAFQVSTQTSDLDALRLKFAAHFSLKEATAKALGTGLKLGPFMGHQASLPPRDIVVLSLRHPVNLSFHSKAKARLQQLRVQTFQAYWAANETFLVSALLLFNCAI